MAIKKESSDDSLKNQADKKISTKKTTTKRGKTKSKNILASDNLTLEDVEKILQRYRRYSRYTAETPIDFKYFLAKMDDEGIQVKLVALWSCWNHIFGESDLHNYAIPLGHKKRTLLIGCVDSIVLQEVTMLKDFILESVNAFLGFSFFKNVKLQVILGDTTLSVSNNTYENTLGSESVLDNERSSKNKSNNNITITKNIDCNKISNLNKKSTDKSIFNINEQSDKNKEIDRQLRSDTNRSSENYFIPKLTGTFIETMEGNDLKNNSRISYVTEAYKKVVKVSMMHKNGNKVDHENK